MLDKITALKKDLDRLRPIPPELLSNLEHWFEIELTYSSNAIEGNTLTRAETALFLEKGLTVSGKSMKDHLEATNHQEALVRLKSMVQKKNISLDDILDLHHIILKGIDDVNAGKIRTIPVRIAGSHVIMPNAAKAPYLMDEFINWLNDAKEHPATLSALCHYRLVSIHPFTDGNGRTARLLMNLVLMRHGYPPALVYPKQRLRYINSLEKAQLGGSLSDYLNLMYESIGHSLEIYLKALRHEEPSKAERQKLLKIGQLAQHSGESTATIRYWTKMGLIDVASTLPSGYQLYEESMIKRCMHIRGLQKKRYTLDEIFVKLRNKS